jgi:hypothetical protein
MWAVVDNVDSGNLSALMSALTVLLTLLIGVIQQWNASRLKREAEQVKKDLKTATDASIQHQDKKEQVIKEIKDELKLNTEMTAHVRMLSNGAKSMMLRTIADLTKWKAENSDRQEDRDAALAAELAYQQHNAIQEFIANNTIKAEVPHEPTRQVP